MTGIDEDEFTELVGATVPRVDLVGMPANGVPGFLLMKQDSRGLLDPDAVRDLIAKSDPATEDMVTMTGSPAAIAKLIHGAPLRAPATPNVQTADSPEGDVTKESSPMAADDLLDAAETLADPEEAMPGADTTPSSPAWEAVDAATARKWTSFLARAKAAVGMLAERELLEATAGDDDDVESAFDLQDAACAIDYAIGVLAPFAVAEQIEAEMGADELNGVRKALRGFDAATLDTIEALGQVRKAGRVLSAGNEAAIRGAVESLQKVLASLPQAPTVPDDGQPVAKGEEIPVVTAPVEPVEPKAPDAPVAKADGDTAEKPQMVAVYDADGNLVGVVDPTDITTVQGAKPKGDGSTEAEPAPAEPATEATPDLTPAPAAEVGTPADATEPEDVNKTTTDPTGVLKSLAQTAAKEQLDAYQAEQADVIAKQAAALQQATDAIEVLKGQVKALEDQPAMPKVFTNGQVPAAHLRGQDRGAAPTDVAKALEVKKALYGAADATEQNRIANEMQAKAIDALAAIQRR